MKPLSRRHLLAAAVAAWPLAALAQKTPPDDLRQGREPSIEDDRPRDSPNDPAPPAETIMMDATETVNLEHSDRIFRLEQATQRLGIYPAPAFSTFTVPADRMPDNFSVDTPVLRVTFAEAVFFDTASDRVRPQAFAILDAVAQSLRGDAPDAAAFVSGHTDNRGAEDFNYNLSINRANAVAEALLNRGVGEVALWRVGFGEAVPLYPNDTAEHLGFNRRVEFLFASRTEPILDYLAHQLDTVCIAGDRRSADRCRREVRVRERFTAVQLTRRPIGVGLDRPVRSAALSRRPQAPRSTVSPPTTRPSVPPRLVPPPVPRPTVAVTAPPASATPNRSQPVRSQLAGNASVGRPTVRRVGSVNADSVRVVSAREVTISLGRTPPSR